MNIVCIQTDVFQLGTEINIAANQSISNCVLIYYISPATLRMEDAKYLIF